MKILSGMAWFFFPLLFDSRFVDELYHQLEVHFFLILGRVIREDFLLSPFLSYSAFVIVPSVLCLKFGSIFVE